MDKGETKTIPLMVRVPGVGDVEVPGFMYVIAFAIRGIPWAIEAASKPEFDVMVRKYYRDQKVVSMKNNILEYKKSIARLEKQLKDIEDGKW